MIENKSIMFPHLPQRLVGLAELATNLWWSWHPAARMAFKRLNRIAWKETNHNPVKMLKELPKNLLENAVHDEDYLHHYDSVLAQFRTEIETRDVWFGKNIAATTTHPIAYFSAEYGLHHSLPFYAGGLGFLAGDYLKECSDLGMPVVAVGFMYPEGYLRQRIRVDGWQENVDEILDRDAAPISRVLNEKGAQLVVKVPFIDPPIHVAVWMVMVGRIPLYLMDTDVATNDPWNRGISAHLYIGDIEQRLRQEIVLGIGGSEVLNTLGIKHSILHLNEGHPGFAVLERIRERIQDGMRFDDALRTVRETTIFTTHTPVPAGHDVFPFHLIEKYFSSYWPALTLDHDAFIRLGPHPKYPNAGFNMTAFVLRASEFHNGVSKRHGEVARRMWQSLWPDRPEERVPIDYVTNGVHVPTWIEPKLELLFNKYLGPAWLTHHDDPAFWELIDDIPDIELWQTHCWLKTKLMNNIREYARQRLAADRVNAAITTASGVLLDPTVLTVGFARRFATYKRANLIFYDRERLKKIITNQWQPVQFIFAGKAHPADDPGKRILQEIFNAAKDPAMVGRIAFVEDYDEQLAQYLVHGVDVWLNNPIPPLEASGTSGMKAALNGVPHLSIKDGWWVEGYNGKNGWSFDHAEVNGDANKSDAESIYRLMEEEIVPCFYRIADDGIPHDWVKVMKAAIKSAAPNFSARRMVKEYAIKFYTEAFQHVVEQMNEVNTNKNVRQ
ncbi:alpha-glucan phosphorylase [candidate division WOR-1 bacterium DG_54_3]|uniref:glycogen phosphorylase n=1 Tax=candidate division WOR-1 bacterium DG_54_3 TaxID=1703775 RepID=A0A0S7Y223_UNCSA|nr:MAG: alpha-glucan phosphorylase [candidate division WOR-1 bacterium DG_54_3]